MPTVSETLSDLSYDRLQCSNVQAHPSLQGQQSKILVLLKSEDTLKKSQVIKNSFITADTQFVFAITCDLWLFCKRDAVQRSYNQTVA